MIKITKSSIRKCLENVEKIPIEKNIRYGITIMRDYNSKKEKKRWYLKRGKDLEKQMVLH